MNTIMSQKTEWVLCPFCTSKTRTKLLPDTELKRYPLFCPKCKQTAIVDAAQGKITMIYKEPDV